MDAISYHDPMSTKGHVNEEIKQHLERPIDSSRILGDPVLVADHVHFRDTTLERPRSLFRRISARPVNLDAQRRIRDLRPAMAAALARSHRIPAHRAGLWNES